jgi:hypothetical protein
MSLIRTPNVMYIYAGEPLASMVNVMYIKVGEPLTSIVNVIYISTGELLIPSFGFAFTCVVRKACYQSKGAHISQCCAHLSKCMWIVHQG